jgi:hypothetical protein
MTSLIPELRTDKNGITSTRWIKPSTSTKARRSLPAPFVLDPVAAAEMDIAEARELRAKIAHSLGYFNVNYAVTREEMRTVESLNEMSVEYLRELDGIAQRTLEQDKTEVNAFFLIKAIENKDFDQIKIITEYGDRLSGSLRMRDLVDTIQKLRSMDNSRTTFSDNLDLHLRAAGQYLELNGSGRCDNYAADEKLIRFVNKNPEHADAALRLRMERKLKKFDVEVMNEYVAGGVLGNGSL